MDPEKPRSLFPQLWKMPQTTVQPGEDIAALAARVFNGDVKRFPEILDLNPNVDVFGALQQELKVQIPSTEQILNYAQPALTEVSQAIGGIAGATGKISSAIQQYSSYLPPQLQGYAKEALDLVGKVNGLTGQAQAAIDGLESEVRKYEGQLVSLVPWLLGSKK